MPNAVMWVARNAKARPTAMPIAVWLVASSSSEGLINAVEQEIPKLVA
jgi:hypothetical protein